MADLSELQRTVIPSGPYEGLTFEDVPLLMLDELVDAVELPPYITGRLCQYLKHPTIEAELKREQEQEREDEQDYDLGGES
jgi:hypothetical protein